MIEATFLTEDAALAAEVGHLTAAQARVAGESGVRRLVLTHFSQRYQDPRRYVDEAREHYDGDLVVAADLTRVPVPPRAAPPPAPTGAPAPTAGAPAPTAEAPSAGGSPRGRAGGAATVDR